MTLNKLIDLADIKEKQAEALLSFYHSRIPYESFQTMVDDYCTSMATSFIETHQEDLQDEELKKQLNNYIVLIGADSLHSGHRFYEALYRKLNGLEKVKEDESLETEEPNA